MSEMPDIAKELRDSNLRGDEKVTFDPTPAQLELTAGDHVTKVAAMPINDPTAVPDVLFGTVMDPAAATSTFGECRDRYEAGYLPVSWFSKDDIMGDVGWFPRCYLIRIPDEHWEEIQAYQSAGTFPVEPPQWLAELYEQEARKVADQNDVATVEQCPECDVPLLLNIKTEIHMVARALRKGSQFAPDLTKGKDPKTDSRVYLSCDACGYTRDLDVEDIVDADQL